MPTLTLTFPEPDIALLNLDTPGRGANILSAAVLDEFDALFAQLAPRTDLAGLILRSTKPGSFVAGADISEFADYATTRERTVAMCRRGQILFGRLANMSFVTVAAIDGTCLGGGSELSLWCDHRIMGNSPRTEFGLPEVKLGLLPGWGGTARLSRLIGLANAIDVITSGEAIDVATAQALGLATDVVPSERLLSESIRLVRDEMQSGSFRQARLRLQQPLGLSTTEQEFIAFTAGAKISTQFPPQNPAPKVTLDLMLAAAPLSLEEACQLEAETMPQLFGAPANRALINIFFLHDRVKRDTGLGRTDVAPQPLKSVGIVGAGVMGAGIAAATLRREIPIAMQDAADDVLSKCVQSVLTDVSFDKKTRQPNPELAIRFATLLSTSTDLAIVAQADLVIEAVTENTEIKRQLFAKLEPLLSPTAILASNTSTIPITTLAEKLARPEQFCGIHFFNPVRKMALVEIVRGEHTNDATIASAVAFCKRIGKLPIVVKDGPGFLVNRLLRSYLNEGLQLLTEGTPLADIERASFAFGMPIGPFTLYDMVGLDTAFYAGRQMFEAFPDRVVASPILPALIKAGRLGQKNGLGFFSYENKKQQPEPDPRVDQLLEIYLRHDRIADQDEITTRLFLPMLLEATRILEEQRVRDVRDIDLGVVFGLGFPTFRGGLMHWADTLGAATIVERLKRIEFLGPRVEPTPLLIEMAASGSRFYKS